MEIKFFKIIKFIFGIVLSAYMMSDANALGVVSRSCLPAGAQESITVDWGFKKYMLWTASGHYRDGVLLHNINTQALLPNGQMSNGWYLTWRSYAGHLGTEYWYGAVLGYHYKNDSGFISFLGFSTAKDCNIGNWGGS